MKPRILVPLFIFSFLVASCNEPDNNSGQPEGNSDAKVQRTKGEVVLSPEELENTSIEIGSLEKRPISEAIACFGTLSALPKQLISITTPMGGRIKKLNFLPGDYVSKGSVMATLEDLGAIKLQQGFLEAKAELKYAKEDYKRQGQLTVEDAASVKKMQNAEASYWKAKARFESLKEQLAILDMDVAAIEKGNIQPHIVLRSPISGYVSMLNGNLGRFVESRTEV